MFQAYTSLLASRLPHSLPFPRLNNPPALLVKCSKLLKEVWVFLVLGLGRLGLVAEHRLPTEKMPGRQRTRVDSYEFTAFQRRLSRLAQP